ncbi:MAG: glycosyltransferase family 39 protein, partial [Bacteroidetes bacterium]|nr:glycosyltransferase family 39 protein [Bacteroidota bacterium]
MDPMQARPSWRGERITVLALICLTWAYVVLRAYLVPFVQDEASSFWWYARTGEFLPFRSYPDAGNHFLSSLFGVIGFKLFGFSAPGVRWGSVLCFPIYAFGCVALARPLVRPVVRWSALLALLWCPFLLDYFSMFRGYGPAMAGWVWALHGLLSFARSGSVRYLVLLSVALALALFADLSLLPAWLFFLLLSVLLAVRYRPKQRAAERRWTILVIVLQLMVTAYATAIALYLREGGKFYLGSGQGFFVATVRSLTRVLLGPDPRLPWVLTVLVLLAVLIAFAHLRRHPWRDALPLLAAVLLADVAARQLMFHLLGTNFPQDRAALHLVPLAILLFAHAVDALCRTRPAWQWAAMPLLAFPLQTV